MSNSLGLSQKAYISPESLASLIDRFCEKSYIFEKAVKTVEITEQLTEQMLRGIQGNVEEKRISLMLMKD